MRKFLLPVAGILCALGLAGCGAGESADAAVGQTVPGNAAAKEKAEPAVMCSIRVTAGEEVLSGVLYDNPTARGFLEMLPLTAETWHAEPDFARAFNLTEHIAEKGTPGYEYELGSLAYWDDGPSVALIYKASREETVVPVVPMGKITSDLSVFEKYDGTISVEVEEMEDIGDLEKEETEGSAEMTGQRNGAAFTADTKVWDVINDPAFEGYGRLLFPADKNINDDLTLGDVGNILTWYSYVNPDRTVAVVNELRERAASGEQIFYDIYTEEEKKADPDKRNTGLFYFKGTPGEKFAITNAGGGFMYVAAMHDSFPHAQELSKKGYNAFALIYRPGARTACEDLSRAVAFIYEHAEELEVDVADYSLWGGSAGARMAAWVGTYGTAAFGEADYPQPGAVIMQYTGLSEVTGYEPPTYACVGTSDGIAYYGTMEERIRQIQRQGTDTEIEVFDGLPHGFGLGEGTVAEGWIDRAVEFWERNC